MGSWTVRGLREEVSRGHTVNQVGLDDVAKFTVMVSSGGSLYDNKPPLCIILSFFVSPL